MTSHEASRGRRRLALFLPSLHCGGVGRVMVHLSRGLADRGLPVDMVLATAEGPYLSDVPSYVRLVGLRASRVLVSLAGLVRYLRRERPRVLLSATSHANIIALWARGIAGVDTRVVVTEHITVSEALKNAKPRRARLLPALMRCVYPSANAIVAVSGGVAEDLARVIGLPRERIHVIYNPVVTPKLGELAKEGVEHSWFQQGQSPVVLGVGRLTVSKDFPMLLRAFAQARRQRAARVVILGEGEERARLQELAEELGIDADLWMPGFVKNPYKYMSRASAFVLSSRWEGLPIALVEAMACGTPVVATDCPSGPGEILEGGRWGRLVPPGNPGKLAEAICDTLADPGPDPRQRAEYFSVERAVDEYLRVLAL